MPIKDKSLYPRNWPLIRIEILTRAGNRCECDGVCGTDHAAQNGDKRCAEFHGSWAAHFRGRVILTTAHLNRNPKDSRRRNLAAFCQGCHLRYDAPHHAFNATLTRERKRGQLRLAFEDVFTPKKEMAMAL